MRKIWDWAFHWLSLNWLSDHGDGTWHRWTTDYWGVSRCQCGEVDYADNDYLAEEIR